MITCPIAKSYNQRRITTSEFCFICGRDVKNPKHFIHVHEGGRTIVTEEEAKTLDPSGDMGGFCVGPECIRNHPEIKPYITY